MLITVAICTWNRAELLGRTLEEMTRLEVPSGVDWELLVVNNACTDRTDEVIAQYEPQLPLRRVYEPKQGLSNARNAAVDAASGELIVWTDDDVLVEPGWLAGYAEAAARWPENRYFGGPIRPWFEAEPPAWLTRHLDLFKGMLVIRDLPGGEGPFEGEEAPFGANMAFRRGVFQTFRFDPRFGLSGNSSMLGEETELIASLWATGDQGIWVPAAGVRHFVPVARMTREFLWKWSYGWGRTIVRMQADRREPPPLPQWRLWVNCWRYRARAAVERLLGRDDWARSYYYYAQTSGMLAERRGEPD